MAVNKSDDDDDDGGRKKKNNYYIIQYFIEFLPFIISLFFSTQSNNKQYFHMLYLVGFINQRFVIHT